MGNSTDVKWIEIVNLPSSPASDDDLVGALLAFANGAEVILSQWRAATVREKQAHPPAPVEMRTRFAELLRLAVEDPKQLRDQFMAPVDKHEPKEPPEKLLALFQAAARDAARDAERKLSIAIDAVRGGPLQYVKEPPVGVPSAGAGAWTSPGAKLLWLRVSHSITLQPHGFSLEYFNYFPDLETAFSYAIMLLIDSRKPYGAAISQCHLARCSRFFLATKKPGGGRPNRKYCDPEHLAEHHNSAERKAATTARGRGRRHK
jgi:hypothetical protein